MSYAGLIDRHHNIAAGGNDLLHASVMKREAAEHSETLKEYLISLRELLRQMADHRL